MARPHTTRKNRRARVRSTAQNNVTGVYAPSYVQGDSEWGKAAEEVGRSLRGLIDVSAPLIAHHRQGQFLEGHQAATEGRELTPEEQETEAFMKGYTKVRTARELLDLKEEAQQMYSQQFDKANGSPEELQAGLDALFNERFAGLDPEDPIERSLIPGVNSAWERIRADIVEQHRQDIKAEAQQRAEADVFKLAEDQYKAEGSVNWEALNQAARPVFGNQGANELLVSVVTDLAIRNGDPSLIDDMPDQWASGAPTPKKQKKWDDALRNARIQAEARRKHLERVAEEQDAEAAAQAQDRAERQLMLDVLSGHDIREKAARLLAEGLLDPETARVMLRFKRSMDSEGPSTPDYDAMTSLEMEFNTGTHSPSEMRQLLADAAEQGKLGSGKELRTNVSRLLNEIDSITSSRTSSPEYRNQRDYIKEILAPKRDAIGRLTGEGNSDAFNHAMRVFNRLVAEGADPLEARKRAMASADENYPSKDQERRTKSREAPEDLAQRALEGDTNAARSLALMPNGKEAVKAIEGLSAAQKAEIIRQMADQLSR